MSTDLRHQRAACSLFSDAHLLSHSDRLRRGSGETSDLSICARCDKQWMHETALFKHNSRRLPPSAPYIRAEIPLTTGVDDDGKRALALAVAKDGSSLQTTIETGTMGAELVVGITWPLTQMSLGNAPPTSAWTRNIWRRPWWSETCFKRWLQPGVSSLAVNPEAFAFVRRHHCVRPDSGGGADCTGFLTSRPL